MNKYTNWVEDIFISSVDAFHRQWKALLPYNFSLDKTKGTAQFEMALAGYSATDIEADYSDGILTIKNKNHSSEENSVEYVHKGIAARMFEFAMPINPCYEVKDASLKDGILKINFKKIGNKPVSKIEIKAV